MAELTYVEATGAALRLVWGRDPEVFLIGEDIGAYQGAFKVTAGLLEEFGEKRVIDTPIAEAGYLAAAVGAAMQGMRPVAEVQFADFLTVCIDPIANLAARAWWRYGQAVPLTIRTPFGGGTGGGPFHSGCPEAWFCHMPGLKVVAPATPYDAKGLLTAAIRDNDPVLFFEHKALYRRVRGEVPEAEYTVPLGEARLARPGSDLSIITYGATVHHALEAAERLAAEQGVSVEVLDLRTLAPLDRPAILATARKTGKVLIAHEANLTGGIGGEVAAIIGQEAFEYLDGPITRVAAPDCPVPAHPDLEAVYLPRPEAIYAAAARLARY